MSDLPETLYIQPGKVMSDDLFVNRTPAGVLNRKLGQGFTAGARVGVYKLERITQFGVGVVEIVPPPAAPAAPTEPTKEN